MQIQNSKDFVSFVTETMEGMGKGEISPAGGAGKILQMISLEMRAMDHPKLADRNVLRTEAADGSQKNPTA